MFEKVLLHYGNFCKIKYSSEYEIAYTTLFISVLKLICIAQEYEAGTFPYL